MTRMVDSDNVLMSGLPTDFCQDPNLPGPYRFSLHQ